ncbi:MAG: DUF547 domain-containing protein [Deltaproteobacteria bacterium]|nr:MAG: DUF547 domain-containing protein [Deltaproteobacteria bacterium]
MSTRAPGRNIPARPASTPGPARGGAMMSLLLSVALATPARAVDHDAFQRVLSTYVDARSRVDYAGIHQAGALDGYLADIAAAELPASRNERIALWINAYNALTIDLIADAWPVASIRDLDGGKVWDTRRFTVAGESLTLNDIEHRRLRPLTDGRIHAAVNCASLGCPPLPRTVFRGATLDSQLDAAAESWVASNAVAIDRDHNTVRFSRIFDWYAEDFAVEGDPDPPGLSGRKAEAANWVAAHADPDTAAFLRAGGYTAEWDRYDWSVNAQ